MSGTFSNNEHSIVIANSFNYTVPDAESKIQEPKIPESKILAWLSPLEPWIRHRDIGAQRIDSIGEWLLKTEEFRRWHNGTSDGSNRAAMFCDGNPGVGKSYIT